MTTAWFEGERSFFMASQAQLIVNDRELAAAWYSNKIVHNPAYAHVVGRFVEADRPNLNKQLFSLEGLKLARPTITHAPMNMDHSSRRVVGAFIGTDLIFPTGQRADATIGCPGPECGQTYPMVEDACPACGATNPTTVNNYSPSDGNDDAPLGGAYASSDAGLNPYIEALGVFWRHYFADEYDRIEAAHAEGKLAFSMECMPRRIQCTGNGGCGVEYAYDGRTSPTYCAHLNMSASDKYLIDPHFTAGALLIPPMQPGWSHAEVHQLVAQHAALAERIYNGVATSFSHLDPREWERMMGELLHFAVK